MSTLQLNVSDSDLNDTLQTLWHQAVFSIIGVFDSCLLLNRLLIRVALSTRGVIQNPHEICCPRCFENMESTVHLFFQLEVGDG